MKKQKRNVAGRILTAILACMIMVTLCACGQDKSETKNSNEGEKESGHLVWYLGGGSGFMNSGVDPKPLFEGVKDTVNPDAIYSSVEWNENLVRGVYMINNKEKDLEKVRKEIPFEELKLTENTYNISTLPVAVYLGAEYICSGETGYGYSEFENVTDREVAVLEFAREEDVGRMSCAYEVDGNTLTFKQIVQTSEEGETFAYELTGVEFCYDFKLSGPYLTLSKGEYSLQLKAYCLTENTERALCMRAYSMPDSPLIADLDCFVSSDFSNYTTKRDGGSYYGAAYKMDDEGRFTFCLEEKDYATGETEETINQYAYIIHSSSSSFDAEYRMILLDGTKIYDYTDNMLERESRALQEQGVDVSTLDEEKIEEIAEKKKDLFEDLYNEFEAQGIDVTINRSTGEIAMDASVLFGGESAEVTEEGKELLNKFLTAYTAIIYNEKYNGFIAKTMIEGHTAPIDGSTYESGLPLSEERAKNVKDYCLSADTEADTSKLAESLEAVGLSNSKPVYGSDGEVDLEASRRVSFRFMVNLN